jgi:hypothetical protein
MLNGYKAKRFAEEDKPAIATVNRELQVLRRAYKLAAASDPPKVGRIPVFKLDREKNARLEFFTPGAKMVQSEDDGQPALPLKPA